MSGYVGPVPHLLTTLPAAPQYLQYTAMWQYAIEHCTVSHYTSSPWCTVHTYPQQVTRVHPIGHTQQGLVHVL